MKIVFQFISDLLLKFHWAQNNSIIIMNHRFKYFLTHYSLHIEMHHVYPVSKGDQLCPLGFHPQVRWPTRCKRCFRDYKEHGSKRGEDVAASSPSLSTDANAR